MTNQIPVLSGRKLNKTYIGKSRMIMPLQGVDFDLYQGEILGIVGESGSGKSTLLKVISGIEKADSGHLYHDGTEYTGAGPSRTGRFLQMVFQDANGSFDPRMTMEKSLKEGGQAGRDEIVRAIEAVGLTENLLSRRPGNLSGGQCQRMSIARALLSHPSVLLCDEITSALDVTTQAQVISLLTDVRDRERVSIILVSHDLALLSMICDRIMVMKDGVIVESGVTGEVINDPGDPYTVKLLDSIMTV